MVSLGMTCKRIFSYHSEDGAAKNNLFRLYHVVSTAQALSKIRSPKTFNSVILVIDFRDMQNQQS